MDEIVYQIVEGEYGFTIQLAAIGAVVFRYLMAAIETVFFFSKVIMSRHKAKLLKLGHYLNGRIAVKEC